MSIKSLTNGFVPLVNIHTNTIAATTTFLKITVDVKEGNSIKAGDVLALVGNVAGIVAAFSHLNASPRAAAVFTAIGVTVGVASVLNSDAVDKLYRSLMMPILDDLVELGKQNRESDRWVSPDSKMVSASQIVSEYGSMIAVVKWNPDSGSVELMGDHFSLYNPSLSDGFLYGGGAVNPPVSIPEPPRVIPRVDISIESIGPSTGQDDYACCNGTRQDKYH